MKKILTIALIICSFWLTGQSIDGMELILQDKFGNNKIGWEVSESGNNQTRVNYQYNLLGLHINKADSEEKASVYTRIDFNKDFVIIADIRSKPKEKKHGEKSCYGLLIGYSAYKYKGEQAWYSYLLEADTKRARISATNESGQQLYITRKNLSNFTGSVFNEIGIKKEGNNIRFFLNGSEIYSNITTKTAGGAITLYAYDKQGVHLRNLRVYTPSESDPVEIAKQEAIAEIITEEEEEMILEAVSNLEFDTGKSSLKSSSMSALNKMAEMMVKNTKFKVILKGHTDSQGGNDTNLKLSQNRVNKVKEYLVSRGISGTRIIALGYGDKQPIASNLTSDGRQKNRRVEFEIVQ